MSGLVYHKHVARRIYQPLIYNFLTSEGLTCFCVRQLKILTFLCSLAFFGLSGVCDPLAGAPAMGDAVCFSIVSAGIVD